jgi:hypothetical protein
MATVRSPVSGTIPAVTAPLSPLGSTAAPQFAHDVAPGSIGSPHTPQ